ncbi:MAG TPA: hypothetical protein VLS45_08735, partial [Methylomicrobium sp.]|nr:hypothetical protein [Methylomicrobium sp.]
MCRRCHQRLDVDCFAGSSVCRPCSRRRSALNGTMHEVSISTSPVSHSYDDYVLSHLDEIEN